MLSVLSEKTREAAERSYAPFSGQKTAAILLLSDGSWVTGVRVENASFPLSVSALQAAWVTAVTAGRHDIVAAVQNTAFASGDIEWLATALNAQPVQLGRTTVQFGELPQAPGDALLVVLDAPIPTSDDEGVALARKVSEGAYVPESDFPVGCVLVYEKESGETVLVPGVNVEHSDWTRGLCGERTALVTAWGLGPGRVRAAYLSCPKDSSATPCGACRQVLVELMPDVELTIDRGTLPAARYTPFELLPHSFSGKELIH